MADFGDWDADGLFEDSAIDVLLQEDGVSLREILKQDDLIQEVRGGNAALVTYLQSPETLRELVSIIVTPATEGDTASHGDLAYKHQYMATEVLCLATKDIIDAFVAQHPRPGASDVQWPHLAALFAVFEKPAPLEAYILGYCEKVVRALCLARPVQMTRFLDAKPSVFDSLMRHMYSTTSGNIVGVLWSLPFYGRVDAVANGSSGFVNQKLLQIPMTLLCNAGTDGDALDGLEDLVSRSVRRGAALLCMQPHVDIDEDVGAQGIDVRKHGVNPGLVSALLASRDMGPRLVKAAMQAAGVNLGAGYGGGGGGVGAGGGAGAGAGGATGSSADELELLRCSRPLLKPDRLPLVWQLVAEQLPHVCTALMEAGAGARRGLPLGRARLSLVKVVLALLRAQHPVVDKMLIESGALKLLVALIFEFSGHSALLTCVTDAFTAAFESASDAVRTHLIVGAQLARRLVATLRAMQPGRAINGPAVALANAILALHASGACQDVSKALTADEAWMEAVKGPLVDANARRGIVLGGEHPEWDSIAGDDARARGVGASMDEVDAG